jgi:hypothetical protein
MLGAMYENGGNTTHRFLDGHPELFVYPFESQLGTRLGSDPLSSLFPVKYRWPTFALDATPAQDFMAIIDEEGRVVDGEGRGVVGHDGPAGPDGGLGVPESSELPPPPPQATKNAENAIVSARLRLVWRPSPSDAGPSVRESVTQSLHLMFALVFGRVAGQKRISSAAE